MYNNEYLKDIIKAGLKKQKFIKRYLKAVIRELHRNRSADGLRTIEVVIGTLPATATYKERHRIVCVSNVSHASGLMPLHWLSIYSMCKMFDIYKGNSLQAMTLPYRRLSYEGQEQVFVTYQMSVILLSQLVKELTSSIGYANYGKLLSPVLNELCKEDGRLYHRSLAPQASELTAYYNNYKLRLNEQGSYDFVLSISFVAPKEINNR